MLADGLRVEANTEIAVVHREAEDAKASAASAVAQVEDLRCEVGEEKGGMAVALRHEVEPLRAELHDALATRDERFNLLCADVDRIRPSAPEANPQPSDMELANSKAVADLQSKLVLMEKKTDNALAKLVLFTPQVLPLLHHLLQWQGLVVTRPPMLELSGV